MSVSTVRVLVVDDEQPGRACIIDALGGIDSVEIAGECTNGRDAVRAIKRLQPDIVFLDIQMPGLDGFGVIERVGVDAAPAIVFVTAFDAHALRAFDVHAIDYVLKPFDDARLVAAARRAMERVRAEKDGDLRRRLGALLEDRHAADSTDRVGFGRRSRITVKDGESFRFVYADQIDWIEAAGNRVKIHCGAKTHEMRSTLTAMVDRLDDAGFVRIHRSAAVNSSKVEAVKPWFGGDYVAVLGDGSEHRVSRVYRDGLLGR